MATPEQLERNIRRFIQFKILFNARFYYPVFAILYLDMGLSPEQFALANTVWAVTIVLLEVPSGALADLVGRRKLLIAAALLMMVEMLLLLCAPLFGPFVLITCILLNRILSGAAEASASGADEALAYDSLAALGRADRWPLLLEKLGRYQSLAFMFSSIAGALIYDADALNKIGAWFGADWNLLPENTRLLPVGLTLISATTLFFACLGFREVEHVQRAVDEGIDTWQQMRETGKWLLRSPMPLALIACALVYDNAVRIVLTFTSSYYRLIDLPEASYGLWGSGFALIGFFAAPAGRRLVHSLNASRSLALVGVTILSGLIGVAMAIPVWGLLFMVPLGFGFYLLNFVVSHHLNAVVASKRRATVLSFKGLATNLSYGVLGAAFAGLLAYKHDVTSADPATAAFGASLPWLVVYFFISLGFLYLFARKRLDIKNEG
jgi:MFS family permease